MQLCFIDIGYLSPSSFSLSLFLFSFLLLLLLLLLLLSFAVYIIHTSATSGHIMVTMDELYTRISNVSHRVRVYLSLGGARGQLINGNRKRVPQSCAYIPTYTFIRKRASLFEYSWKKAHRPISPSTVALMRVIAVPHLFIRN